MDQKVKELMDRLAREGANGTYTDEEFSIILDQCAKDGSLPF
jgi:hypothetical protein